MRTRYEIRVLDDPSHPDGDWKHPVGPAPDWPNPQLAWAVANRYAHERGIEPERLVVCRVDTRMIFSAGFGANPFDPNHALLDRALARARGADSILADLISAVREEVDDQIDAPESRLEAIESLLNGAHEDLVASLAPTLDGAGRVAPL